MLITPARLASSQIHASLSTEEDEGLEADAENTSDRGGGEVVDELHDGLAHMNNLNLTWGFELDASFEGRVQQAPAAGNAVVAAA